MKNEYRRKPAAVFALLIVGVILVVLGFFLLSRNVGRYVETTAAITKVEGTAFFRSVSVSYTVDGRLYENVPIGSGSADDVVGAETVVYYDPEDPSVIESQSGSAPARYCLLFGALMTTYGILALVRNRKTIFVRPVGTKKNG